MLISLIVLALAASGGFSEYVLVWRDEFDFLDLNKWQYEVAAKGGGNGEFQAYTTDSKNSWVQDGKLFIKPSLLIDNINPLTRQPYGGQFMQNGILNITALYGSCTNRDDGACYRTGSAGNIPPVMSACLSTYQRFSFKFGRVEISAKMPVGDWLWPAMWMMPETSVYGNCSASGEIDIVESIGNRDFVNLAGQKLGIQKASTSLNWGPMNQNRWWLATHANYNITNNFGDNFHTYVLDWSANGLRFFIDDMTNSLMDVPKPLIDSNPNWVDFWTWGQPWSRGTTNPWAGGSNLAPFDQAFHFILNVAVGGTHYFIPDFGINRGGNAAYQKPWSNGESYTSAIQKFYKARGNWKWTWDQEGNNNAMQVDYIRVYKRKGKNDI